MTPNPEPATQPKCIIFDLDGTLVDSEKIHARAFSDLLHIPHLNNKDIQNKYSGWKLDDILNDLSKTHSVPIPDQFVSIYRQHVDTLYKTELIAFDGVESVLESVALPMCVASNSPLRKIEVALKTTGLDKFFGSNIFSAYEVGTWKPDPTLFQTAAKVMNFSSAECLVVEDSDIGVVAAKAAGMRYIQFQPECGRNTNSRNMFRSYAEFPEMLKQISGK